VQIETAESSLHITSIRPAPLSWPLAPALLLPGCGVLFGIDKVPPAIEVNHGHVTISYRGPWPRKR
jgi:hypothetical protein